MKPPSIMGRPKKVKTVKELQKIIQKYFNECFKLDKETGEYINIQPITIRGIALACNVTYDTLIEWSKREDFSETILRAKLFVEEYTEKQLFNKDKPTNGIKFSLINNFKWQDKSVVESTNTNVNKTLNIEIIDKDQNPE